MLNTPVDTAAYNLKVFVCAFPDREREIYKKSTTCDSKAVAQRGRALQNWQADLYQHIQKKATRNPGK
jgi:hypothetical protein